MSAQGCFTASPEVRYCATSAPMLVVIRCAKLTHAAPAHPCVKQRAKLKGTAPAHPCVKQRAKLKGTAPAHPCARGVPFILNITVHGGHIHPKLLHEELVCL